MKRRVKFLSLAFAFLLAVSAFSGCNGNGQPLPGKEETGENAVSAVPKKDSGSSLQDTAESGDKVRLTWLYFGNPDEQKQWEATSKFFTDSQDKIEVEYIPCAETAYTQKLLTMFASNEAPDTFYARNAETPTLLKEGKMLELSALIDADPDFDLKDYENFENINKPYLADGKVYAVTDNDNPMVFYYNKDLIEETGFEDPYGLYQEGKWTWETFEAVCNAVNALGSADRPLYSYIVEGWNAAPYLWSGSNGVKSFYEDGKPLYNSAPVLEALDFVTKNIEDETFLYSSSSGKGLDTAQLFQTGQLAFSSGGRWMVPTYKNISDFGWNVVPWPKGPSGDRYIAYTPGYTAYAINADTKHPEEAWAWFKFFVGKEGQTENYGKGGNCVPTIKGLIEEIVNVDAEFYPNPDVFIDMQKVSNWPDLEYALNTKESDLVNDYIQQTFMLDGTPKENMDALCDEINSGMTQ